MSLSMVPSGRSITLLCTRFWPDAYGGLEHRALHMSRTLAAAGWRVKVLTENRVGALPTEELQAGLLVRRLPKLDPGRLWRWMDLLRLRWWRKAVRAEAPRGPIWATDPVSAAGAILAGRSSDLIFNPACCTNAMEQTARVRPWLTTLHTGAVTRWAERQACRRARAVVIGSENLRRQFARYCAPPGKALAANMHVVPHGVEAPPADAPDRTAARCALGLNDDEWIVGFVGRLDPVKDLGFLFQAAAQGGLGPKGRLLIVGQGPDRERLQCMAKTFELSHQIVWTGAMADPAPAYAAMDVMVLPSVYEAFGNVVMEAMAAGRPVVGRRHDDDPRRPVLTANAELIDHEQTGLLCDPHDPLDLAHKLSQLHQAPAVCRRLGEQARAAALARPWLRVIEEYVALIEREAADNGAEEKVAA